MSAPEQDVAPDIDTFRQAYKSLEENPALLAALTLVLACLVVRLLTGAVSRRDVAELPSNSAPATSDATDPAVVAEEGERSFFEILSKRAKMPEDSAHSLLGADGDLKGPTMCPFFQAFKEASKRADKESEEEKNIARAADTALKAVAAPLSDKYTSVPTRNKNAPVPSKSTPAPDKSTPAPDKSTPAPDKSTSGPDKSTPVSGRSTLAPDKSTPAPDISVKSAAEAIESVPFAHLPADLKRREQDRMLSTLSAEERRVEQEAVSDQLRQIYGILEAQRDSLGGAASLEELRNQMRLYT